MWTKTQIFALAFLCVALLIVINSPSLAHPLLQNTQAPTLSATESAQGSPTATATSSAAQLPGASGKPLEFLVQPPPFANAFIDTQETFMLSEIKQVKGPVIFPSGVTKLYLVVQYMKGSAFPAMDVALVGANGPVEFKGFGVVTRSSVGDLITMPLKLEPESGKFEDGPYQVILSADSVKMVVLNFQVGNTLSTPSATIESTASATMAATSANK